MDNHDLHDMDGMGVSPEELDNLKSMGLDPNSPLSDILKSILDPNAAPTEAAPEPASPPPEPQDPPVSEEPPQEPEEDELELDDLSDLDTFQDSGEYRSYSGNREYRSFDAALPDASPDEWYHYSDEDLELDEDDEAYDYDYEDEEPEPDAPKRRHRGLNILGHTLLVFLTILSVAYLVGIYSNIPVIASARTMYIRTAMTTLNHKWLATAFIPSDIIDDIMIQQYDFEETQSNHVSNPDWGISINELPKLSASTIDSSEEPESSVESVSDNTETAIQYSSEEEALFYQVFWELDYDTMSDYLKKNPDALDNGWYGIDINEAGLDDEGTSIKTIYGDQVLAVNAAAGIVLVRVVIPSSTPILADSRGVLAIAKDTSRLSLCPASTLGTIGQTAERICEANDGILAISGSAFDDPEGMGNGGKLSGLAVCSGTTLGTRLGGSSKRIELRENNQMYIVNSDDEVDPTTRDAAEFQPALIIDGKLAVDETTFWNSPNPRCVLGQSSKMETMMVIIEGRLEDSPGCSVVDVAELMLEYGCAQALNLDGGTSAVMYYDGEYVTRCSNKDISSRTLPTAWVYK